MWLLAVMQLPAQTEADADVKTGISITGDYHDKSQDTVELKPQLLPERIREGERVYKENKEPPVQKPSSPAKATINEALNVGTTVGFVGVTATGAASYQIPVEIPKGIAGLEPDVSIGYNSQGGNGLAGYGWNLSASSVISRSGKTFYYDNAADAPQLNNTDNIMLDGRRMILISGQNLVNGARYRLEYDPATDIAYKVIGSYYCFSVRTKDGSTREYGSTATSNIQTSGGSTLFWLLSKITDKNGNTITFDYDVIANNGEFYPSEINYVGNRSIQFAYETRNDKQKSYFAGVAVNRNKRLEKISTYIGQTRIKDYEFNYEAGGLYSKLSEVIEKGQDNAQYNPVMIDYEGSETYADEYLSSLSENREGHTPLFADFNGDGKMDFLSYPNKSSYTVADKATLFLSETLYGDVYFHKQCTIPVQPFSSTFRHFALADLNGDGKMDVINIARAPNNTDRYNYYLFDGECFSYNGLGFNTDGDDAFTGDFNGDGKQDILVKNNNKVFDGTGSQIASGGIDNWGSDYIEDYYPNSRYLCDFNGNGKADILAINASGAWVYELNGSSFTKLTSFNTTDIKNYYFPYFGDFNGDGNTDVLIQNINQGSYNDVSILYSTGKGFVKQSISGADINAKVFVADFNKDGKSDIFHLGVANNTVTMKVGTYNGTNFNTAYYSTFLSPADFNVPIGDERFLFQTADFDGDGRAEFCNAKYVDTYILHSFTDDNDLPVRVITDGTGAQISFDYAPITDNNYCSCTDDNISFPVSGSAFPLYVVTNMGQYAGSYYDNTTYRYKNPRVHVQGKGFLNFGEVITSNYNRNRKVSTKSGYNSTYYFPFVTEVKTTTLTDSDISTSVYENSYIYHGSKRVTPYVQEQTDTDHLTGIVTTVECTQIDSWANPLRTVTAYGSDVTETVVSSYFNSSTDNLWILGLPLSVEKKTTKSSANWIEKQTFEYNTQNLLWKLINYTGDGTKKVSENSFIYDSFGNINAHSSIAYSSSSVLTASCEYSTDGVFMTKVTDPLSLETTYNFNSSGRLFSSTDPRNNTTTYEYDGMGRLTQTNYPDGTSSSLALSWGGSVSNSVYYITKTATGQPVEKNYYDAIDRKLRNSTERFDGSETHHDTKYDNAGRIYQVSLPFKGSSTPKWNTCSYDGYGRISQVSYASGKTDSYTYSGNSVTATKNGISSQKTFNAKGELVNVTDPAGTIIYNLRPDGQPVSVRALNVNTSFTYDDFGRQTAVNDPSAGLITFEYDSDGNLLLETDAEERSKTMLYDQYGRIISKALPEFTTTYNYNNYGQLIAESSTNGTSRTYLYDSYGRLYKDKDNAPDGKWLEKTYSYSGGNISSILFNSHSGTIGTESYSYGYGNLKEITFGGSSVWKLMAENTMGIPTSVTTGNITRSYSYDDYGLLTGRSSTSPNGGTFQNCSYDFSATTGNLSSRKDNGRNKQENFSYDGMNRLTSYGDDLTVDYYTLRNIIKNKEDVSNEDYSYCWSDNVFGLSEIYEASSDAIPVREQHITYTSFERPSVISENDYAALFTYDGSSNRKKMRLEYNGTAEFQHYYLGERYEGEFGTSVNKQILYIGGDAYSAPVALVNQGNSWNFYYICRDHLGSMTHLVYENGTLAQEYSYDAWGRLRDPSTQAVYIPDDGPPLLLGRGYTGHEHLPLFGLINMNARLYDPATGYFLSPDQYIQLPDFTLSYNRYAYCMNNPLVYVDESGELAWFYWAGAALVGGVANLVANWDNVDGFWQGVASFGIGAGSALGIVATGGSGAAAVIGAGAAGGAAVGATNSVVAQTGYNFSGFNNVNWEQVGINSAVGGVAGAAGSGAGYWASNASILVNGVNSPVLRSAIVSPLASGAGHVAGGTTVGLFQGQNLGEAFVNSFDGIGKSMAIGGAIGVASTIGVSYANGINPWTGKAIPIAKGIQKLQYDTKQIGGKYGKHMKDYPGMSHDDYLNLAKDIYSNPSSTKIIYPSNAPMYPGEIHYHNNGNLLRIGPDGMFRSLYPY
jgi:RHS repeat-associated protein